MFQSIINPKSRVARVVLLLMCCLFALLPLAALADGTGPEPPIQEPDPNGLSVEYDLIVMGVAILSALGTIP